MSNKNQKTIADIEDAMRNEGHTGEASCLEWVRTKMTYYADRIEEANEREIAAKDAEIGKLRECLREAVREKCPFTRMSCRYGEPCEYVCGTDKWRNALKGSNNATK